MQHHTARDLVARLGTQLPLTIELADPISGRPFTVNRDNVLALLAIDIDNLVLESQTVAMLFGEMARVHAAAKIERDMAEVRFRQWKAAKSAHARSTLDNGVDAKGNRKSATSEQIEEHYRSDADYEHEYRKTIKATVFADLIEDLKEGFRIKQRSLHALHGITFGHDAVQADDSRLRDLAAVSEEAATAMMSASGALLADIREQRLPPPPVQTELKAEPKAATKQARRPAPGVSKL